MALAVGHCSLSLLHLVAGAPHYEASIEGDCRTCGCSALGIPFAEWVRDTFTDHNRLRPGSIICPHCLFAFEEANPLLAQRVGKSKPQRTRNYSHFVLNDAWIPLSKGDKLKMRAILMQSPQVAVIAESGQKHILFRAQLGWWQFEEQSMLPCPELLTSLLQPIEHLYNAGANKSEIETGRYSQKTLIKMDLGTWRACERTIAPHRGSLPLQLAIFLAQKDDHDDT